MSQTTVNVLESGSRRGPSSIVGSHEVNVCVRREIPWQLLEGHDPRGPFISSKCSSALTLYQITARLSLKNKPAAVHADAQQDVCVLVVLQSIAVDGGTSMELDRVPRCPYSMAVRAFMEDGKTPFSDQLYFGTVTASVWRTWTVWESNITYFLLWYSDIFLFINRSDIFSSKSISVFSFF